MFKYPSKINKTQASTLLHSTHTIDNDLSLYHNTKKNQINQRSIDQGSMRLRTRNIRGPLAGEREIVNIGRT